MDSQYPTAPELPHKVPQLVRSGKAPEAEAPQSPLTDPEFPDDPEEEAEEDRDELNEHVQDPGDPDGVVAAEQQKDWRDEYQASAAKPKKKRRWPLVILILLVLIAVTVGAYLFATKKAAAPAAKTPAVQSRSTSTKNTEVPTKAYTSDTYALSFDYPGNWTISDTSAKLTVTSPATTLTDSSGKQTQGQVAVSIQNQQTSIANYPANGATAVLASDKLTYKQPTQVQRAQTYLSYLSYQGAGLDALYITGDNGYQKDQTIPMSDVVKGNPLISVMFTACGDTACQTPGAAMTLQPDAWQGSNVAKQVTALLESLQLN